MECEECEKMKELIQKMSTGMEEANIAIKILNTKIKEQEATIMKLNNGIVKAVGINSFKDKIWNG